MISKISFGSRYVISNRDNCEQQFKKVSEFCSAIQKKKGVKIIYQSDCRSDSKDSISSQYFISIPKKNDSLLESYCDMYGIEYKKYGDSEKHTTDNKMLDEVFSIISKDLL